MGFLFRRRNKSGDDLPEELEPVLAQPAEDIDGIDTLFDKFEAKKQEADAAARSAEDKWFQSGKPSAKSVRDALQRDR